MALKTDPHFARPQPGSRQSKKDRARQTSDLRRSDRRHDRDHARRARRRTRGDPGLPSRFVFWSSTRRKRGAAGPPGVHQSFRDRLVVRGALDLRGGLPFHSGSITPRSSGPPRCAPAPSTARGRSAKCWPRACWRPFCSTRSTISIRCASSTTFPMLQARPGDQEIPRKAAKRPGDGSHVPCRASRLVDAAVVFGERQTQGIDLITGRRGVSYH